MPINILVSGNDVRSGRKDKARYGWLGPAQEPMGLSSSEKLQLEHNNHQKHTTSTHDALHTHITSCCVPVGLNETY